MVDEVGDQVENALNLVVSTLVLSNRTGQAGDKINLSPNLTAILTGHGRTSG